MISFEWTVQPSFIGPRHGLTIRTEVYAQLEKEGINDVRNLEISFPDGTRMTGRLIWCHDNWGDYYQISFHVKNQAHSFSQFKTGQCLRVEMENKGTHTNVKLRFARD